MAFDPNQKFTTPMPGGATTPQEFFNSLSPTAKQYFTLLSGATAMGGLQFGPGSEAAGSPVEMALQGYVANGDSVPSDDALVQAATEITLPVSKGKELLLAAGLLSGGLIAGAMTGGAAGAGAAAGGSSGAAGGAGAATTVGAAIKQAFSGATGTPAGNALTATGSGISAAASAAGNTGRANADTNAANQSLFQQELNNNAKTEATQRTGALSNLYRMNNITNPVSASDPFGSAGQQTFSPQYTSALQSLANQGGTMLAQPAKYAVNGPNMPTPTYTPYTPSALQTLGNVVGPVASVGGNILNGLANKGPASNGPAGTVTPPTPGSGSTGQMGTPGTPGYVAANDPSNYDDQGNWIGDGSGN
jgi:hypothetical protein